jgi:hypothetical protein
MLGHTALLQLQPAQQQQQKQQYQQQFQQQQQQQVQMHPVHSINITQQQPQATAAAAAAACNCGGMPQPGLPIFLSGSPFGCLAAQQFHGALLTGVVSNVLQQPGVSHWKSTTAGHAAVRHSEPLPAEGSGSAVGDDGCAAAAAAAPALFVVDARVMPGMEGGAISCRCGGCA